MTRSQSYCVQWECVHILKKMCIEWHTESPVQSNFPVPEQPQGYRNKSSCILRRHPGTGKDEAVREFTTETKDNKSKW